MGDFVGAGWAFPVRADATGAVALVTREREVAEAVRIVLGTTPGERPMRPEFGCRIWDHVFDVAGPAMAGQVAFAVRAALERWEPRIDVTDVLVTVDADDATRAWIDVRYALREGNDPRNLVVPFYVIPAEPPLAAATRGA